MRPRLLTALALSYLLAAPAWAQRFNWDELGQQFCRLSTAADPGALRPILSPSLATLIETAARRVGGIPPRFLFQAFDAETTGCMVRTRNVALVEITRSWPGGAWTDYLVITPERDGSMRIDDVLFATRRSDTLRSRLNAVLTSR